MKRWNLPIALYLFLIFVSGAVVGALGYRLYSPPPTRAGKLTPDEWRRQYLSEMQTRVNLTPDQLEKLNAILDGTHTRFHAAREKNDQIMKQIREDQFAQVRAILTPEQVPKYEQLRADREQRAKAAGKK